jgi:hypothetical protein
MMSEGGFSGGQLPAEAHSSYLLQGSHSNSSSIAGSEEDSMDKSEDGDEDEEDVRITPERRKDNKQKVDEQQQQQQQQPEKKRNPYSIEELLKKPDNSKKPPASPATLSLQTMFLQPPCGLLVDKPCTCSLVSAVRPHQEHEASCIDLIEASSSSSCASSVTAPISMSQTESLHKQTATCNT